MKAILSRLFNHEELTRKEAKNLLLNITRGMYNDWDRDGHSFNEFVVEERNYEDYMYYCPIPNSEILKFSNLVQNRGWK